MHSLSRVPTYGMQQRSERADFHIREKAVRTAAPSAHRHEYFQIQINLGEDTVQHIGNLERPFPRHAMAFILPHRIHFVPPQPDGHVLLINFDQNFLLPHLQCSPLDLEEVTLHQAPELSPFRFQQHLDFLLEGPSWEEAHALLQRMRQLDGHRRLLHLRARLADGLARRRQRHAVGRSLEERRPERLLQRPQAARDGGLVDLEPSRGRAQAAGAAHLEEEPDVAPFHATDCGTASAAALVLMRTRDGANAIAATPRPPKRRRSPAPST